MTDAEHAELPRRRPDQLGRLERRRHRARLPERGRRRPQAARRRSASESTPAPSHVAVVAPQNQPTVGQIVDRDEIRDAAQSRVEVTQSVLDEFGIEAVGAVMDPRAVARPRRRRARVRARRGPALRACTRPASASRARTWSSGRRPALDVPVDPHPGPRRRRRGPLGRHPHPRRRHPDGQQPRPGRAPQGARRRQAAPLHDHLPALGRRHPRGRLPAARGARSPSCTATTSTRPASR